MPFINTKVSCTLSEDKERAIKEKLGKAITLIGKSESWLMLSFEDGCRMWFRGEQDADTAYVEISLFGKASSRQYEDMTAKVTQILCEELPLSPQRVYVKYEEADIWGWNGGNF